MVLSQMRRIDFVKLDVQGSEVRAITGMSEILRRFPHVRILTEFSPFHLTQCGAQVSDLCDLLLGRQLFLLRGDGQVENVSPDDLIRIAETEFRPRGHADVLAVAPGDSQAISAATALMT